MGNTVKIRIPEYKRGRSDSRNIFGIILEVDEDKYLFEIATKEGHLAQTYFRNQLNICQENFIFKENVPDVIVHNWAPGIQKMQL